MYIEIARLPPLPVFRVVLLYDISIPRSLSPLIPASFGFLPSLNDIHGYLIPNKDLTTHLHPYWARTYIHRHRRLYQYNKHDTARVTMHVLGHSFCEKRKSTKRPRDLHIRKVSFSGSSLSGCSLSSSDSTASAVTAILQPQHADHAPRRLHERAMISSPSRRDQPRSFFDDADSIAVGSDDEDEEDGDDDVDMDQFVMEMPPHTPEADHSGDSQQEPMMDYFHFHLTKRPSLPRSRWSESTISSIQTIEAMPTPGASFSTIATEQEDERTSMLMEMPPNFSYKRAVSTPAATNNKRPPMKHLDSIEEFVKRGGWKRRGIVFQQEEVNSSEES